MALDIAQCTDEKEKLEWAFRQFSAYFFQKILKVTPVVYPRLISNHNCIIARGNPWKKGIFIFFVKIAPLDTHGFFF